MNCIILTFILLIYSFNAAKIIDNIEYIDQTEDYPTGCESISTIMCLHYWKINITPEDFIDNYLEKGLFYYKNGQLFAPHPSEKFVGSPYDDNSYGCYEPVIEKALNSIIKKNNLNFEVKNLTNVSMDIIKSGYIDNNIPVIFWATINMKPFFNGSIWIVSEGNHKGEKFQWRAREHCLLLIGYDDNNYIFHYPWENKPKYSYDKNLIEKRHAEQYSMAVALVPKNSNNNE